VSAEFVHLGKHRVDKLVDKARQAAGGFAMQMVCRQWSVMAMKMGVKDPFATPHVAALTRAQPDSADHPAAEPPQ
jgi:hypothetical protein